MLTLFMGLFGRPAYHPAQGVPMRRGISLRTTLMVLGIILGLYFLNLAFLWVKIPAVATSFVKPFNVIVGVLIILLGLMTFIRPRN